MLSTHRVADNHAYNLDIYDDIADIISDNLTNFEEICQILATLKFSVDLGKTFSTVKEMELISSGNQMELIVRSTRKLFSERWCTATIWL